MKNTVKIIGFGGLLMLLLLSCAQNDTTPYIDSELQELFDNFKSEASLRDVQIDYEALSISGGFMNIESNNIVGQCQSLQNGSSKILIDQSYWNRISEIRREFLVFHELGHCALSRSHDNKKSSNNFCLSIMQSGDHRCKDNYNLQTRKEYLDELFEI